MKSIRSWLSSSSVGLIGLGPAAMTDRFGTSVSRTASSKTLEVVEHVAEADLVADVEDVVNLRPAEVGVDQQDSPAVEGQARGQVAGDRGLAVAGRGAGDQDAARGVQRRDVLQARADLAELLGDDRVRGLDRSPAAVVRRRPAGRRSRAGSCPAASSGRRVAMSRGERTVVSVISRRNAMPRLQHQTQGQRHRQHNRQLREARPIRKIRLGRPFNRS